jgi:hypothetical protein
VGGQGDFGDRGHWCESVLSWRRGIPVVVFPAWHSGAVEALDAFRAVAMREVVNGIVQMRHATAMAMASRHATMPVHTRPAQSKTYRTVR